VVAAGDIDIVRAVVLAALLALAGCTVTNQPAAQGGRTFLPAAGSDGGGGGGKGM
jgi:hypothetical protein